MESTNRVSKDPKPYDEVKATEPSPIVVEIPHAGVTIDDAALAFRQLPPKAMEAGALTADADLGSDVIWQGSETMGVSRVVAKHSRYVIDLNTTPRFPTAYEEKMPEPLRNVRQRSACGLTWSVPPLPRAEIERRVSTYFEPYHRAVDALLLEAHQHHQTALLISSHTFPKGQVPAGVDVVLGTRHGESVSPDLGEVFAEVLREHGLSVVFDNPFAGGYASGRHARPEEKIGVIQLELRRELLCQAGPDKRFELDLAAAGRLTGVMQAVLRRLLPCVTRGGPRAR